ncbi:phage capsid family protein [Clostridium tepidiprofundi DSM 19306]|uniref:Phage capsid family protein n=1 Tax=Clostridium tepidiprofundi DSM 19306 TaxID=1121338 RepID=A0A151B7D0_9CLOT|nr:phage major capsid protein [Clostridium tepidiprofundi]KYH35838.1 phage capsid family protein [Clostridium tepidiprofundi DSM 19306]
MSKKRQELKNQIEILKAEARQLVEENKMTEAKNKVNEAKELKNQLDLMDELEALEVQNATGKQIGELKDEQEQEQLYQNAFFKALKGKRLTAEDREILEFKNSLSESTDADGGLIVPNDIQTKINEYKRSLIDLSQLATIEPVSSLTGSRVIEKIATMTPLVNITDDTADIDEMASPQFETVSYTIQKYAGWLPIPNDLLKDSDQNIINYLKKWIGKKSIVTNNTLFLAILNSLSEKTFADYKAIKKALNVTLDPIHAVGAKILTNQDGFQYLDTLEDKNGRPLLKDDITQPTRKILFGKPVIVVPNSQLSTTGTTTKYAPIYVGDFKEGVIKFDRQRYEIASTNVGGTAFRKDRTELRVIEREQYKAWDSAAVARGKIDVTAVV